MLIPWSTQSFNTTRFVLGSQFNNRCCFFMFFSQHICQSMLPVIITDQRKFKKKQNEHEIKARNGEVIGPSLQDQPDQHHHQSRPVPPLLAMNHNSPRGVLWDEVEQLFQPELRTKQCMIHKEPPRLQRNVINMSEVTCKLAHKIGTPRERIERIYPSYWAIPLLINIFENKG